jgi:hypothetical protein
MQTHELTERESGIRERPGIFGKSMGGDLSQPVRYRRQQTAHGHMLVEDVTEDFLDAVRCYARPFEGPKKVFLIGGKPAEIERQIVEQATGQPFTILSVQVVGEPGQAIQSLSEVR